MLDTRRYLPLSILFVGCLVLVGTTQGKDFEYTGFLTLDYSKLGEDPDFKGALSWKAKDASFCDYDKVLLEPIEFHLGGGKKEGEKVKAKDQEMMKQFFFAEAREVFGEHFKLADEPGADVLRIRLAITDLLKSKTALQLLPQTHLMGAGRGGAAMEGEMQDGASGKVLAAFVQGGKADRAGSGIKKWAAAKAEIKDWAKHLEKRLSGCK